MSYLLSNTRLAVYRIEREDGLQKVELAGGSTKELRDSDKRTEQMMHLLLQHEGRFMDEQLRDLWRFAGGDFHGPKVETGTMPEALLLPLLRMLVNLARD